MPFYRWYVPEGSVPLEKRQEVARAFTDIHCESTGAPRSFVHVAFFEDGDSDYPKPYYLDGGNRAGRSKEVKQKLLRDLLDAFTDATGVSPDQVDGRITEAPASWSMEGGAVLTEAPASWSMEGGAVLPEPGKEGKEWYEPAAH